MQQCATRTIDKTMHICRKTLKFVANHYIFVSAIVVALPISVIALGAPWLPEAFAYAIKVSSEAARLLSPVYAAMMFGAGAILAGVRLLLNYVPETRGSRLCKEFFSYIGDGIGSVIEQGVRIGRNLIGDISAYKKGIFEQDRLHQVHSFALELEKRGLIANKLLLARADSDPDRVETEIFSAVQKNFEDFPLDVEGAKARLRALFQDGFRRPLLYSHNPLTVTKMLWVLEPNLIDNHDESLARAIPYIDLDVALRRLRPHVRDVRDMEKFAQTRYLPALPRHRSENFGV